MSTRVLVWSEMEQRAIEAFGGFGPSSDVNVLVAAFTKHPTAVERALEHTIGRYKQGAIRAPWRVWRMECERPGGDIAIPVDDVETKRDERIARAEMWIRNAGLMFPTAQEVLDELFSEQSAGICGSLRAYDSEPLRSRMADLWAELQPKAEEVYAAEIERAEAWKTHPATKWSPPTMRGHLGGAFTPLEPWTTNE